MNKKIIISKSDNTIRKLKVLAKKKENVRGKLVVTAEGKEDVRQKLAVTAKQLAATAKEKEGIRSRLAVTAKNLAVTAKEKEDVRKKLEVTADELAATAEEKENIRGKLVVTAKQLAATAETLRLKAKELAVTAEEKENIRRKLAVTAEELKLKAENLAVTAEEKEDIRSKLVVTAKEKEDVRKKLEVTAEKLAATAKEKEDVRGRLAVTAEELKLKAENLAVTAKEKEDIRLKLEVTAEELALTAKKIESANKYARSLIEANLDPLVTISPEGKVTDVNEAMIKVTGVHREQLIGTDFSDYFTEPEKSREGYRKVLKEGSVTDYPLTIKAKDGKFIDVLYNATVYKDTNGNVLGVFAAARDITEQKALARSKDEFFSIASHELRTPLTAIRGNTALIEQYYMDKIQDPNFKEMIADIHESSERLIEIVNDFLDLSRLEQGKLKFSLEEFDIGSVIEDTVKVYQVTGSQKKLYISFNPPQIPLPKVFADKNKTRQILINLIGNALKFTDEGGITITAIPSSQLVKVLVSDTGRGISAENQKLLFRKFQQAGSSLLIHDTTKGTGLGLYISKLIIEGMGGKINLEKSEEGKGTTFSFLIPISTQQLKDSRAPITRTDINTGLTTSTPNLNN